MAIETQKFIRKPLYVDAVRITNANFEDVAAWCQGEVLSDEVPGKGTSKKYIKVRVHNPKNPRQTKAFVGDWLLYTERGYKVYTNKAFHASFDLAAEVEYPREDGDTTVIGPECFVARDGSVLSWRGVNYVPQESVLAGTIDEKNEVSDSGIEAILGTPEEVAEAIHKGNITEDQARENAELPQLSDDPVVEEDDIISPPPTPAITPPVNSDATVETDEDVSKQETVAPTAAEDKRVLSIEEQQNMTPEAVRELIVAGEVVLAQDVVHP